MTIEINRWFPTVIGYTFLNNINNDDIVKNAYKLKDKYKDNIPHWDCDVFTTHQKESLENYSEYNLLFEECTKTVQSFIQEFNLGPEIKLDYSWLNISSPGNFQEYHIHTNSHISAVYYLKTPENSGNIVFQPSQSFTDMFPLPSKNGKNLNTYDTCRYCPKESMLIMFRSNLPHMVTKNYSNDDRISVAMNFSCKY